MVKINFFLITLVFLSLNSVAQSSEIVGSWIFRDSAITIQFFAKANGVIEERRSGVNENVWIKTPKVGTYTFNKKGKLTIIWADKNIENRLVKFKENLKGAAIQFGDNKKLLFLKIVDEEITVEM